MGLHICKLIPPLDLTIKQEIQIAEVVTRRRVRPGFLVRRFTCSAADNQIDEKTAVDFAHRFQSEIKTGQAQAAISEFDVMALLTKAEEKINAPAGYQDSFNSTCAPALSKSLTDSLIKNGKSGGLLVFRFCTQRDGQSVVAFRTDMPNGAVNYLDYDLREDADGQVKIVDIYTFTTAELMSATVRRMYLAAVVAADKTLAGQLGQKERDFVNNLDRFSEMTSDISKRDYQGALDVYATMPASVQHEKFVLTLRVSSADNLSKTHPEEYKAAVDDFTKYYPNDPSLALLTLDQAIENKDYAAALSKIDQLMTQVGDDAYLETARAGLLIKQNDPADLPKAITADKQAIHLEPHRKQAYWGLVTAYLKQRDYQQTAATLTLIQRVLHLKINDLTRIPIYSGFVKSPEYQQWISTQPHPAAATQPENQ